MWQTDDFGEKSMWDATPFFDGANVLTMQKELIFYWHSNHFTIDVDDDFRILVLRAMGDAQHLLPTHLPGHPQHDAATDHFLSLHCRYSLDLMLRGGDISEFYPNS